MSRKIYFYDRRDIRSQHGLHIVYGPVQKKGPVDWPRPHWDLGEPSVFAGSIVGVPGGGYRLYYSGGDSSKKGNFAVSVAESEDGITWTKPALGQVVIAGDSTNRIMPEDMPDAGSLTQPQVVLMPDGTWLMWAWWHAKEVGKFRYVRAESSDGISWRLTDPDNPAVIHPADRELGQNAWVAGLTQAATTDGFAGERIMDWDEAKRLRSNDATYVYFDQRHQRLEMYSVWLMPVDTSTHRQTPHDNAPQVLRVIHRRESTDGLTWSDAEMLILADEHDPLHQQFYYLAVQPDDDWYIGMLGHYRCWEQTMDLELCFSRDLHRWARPLRGGWVPRGSPSETDHMSIYAPNRLIDLGDRWRLLYRAGNQKHNRELPDGVDSIRRDTLVAEMPKGRFAGVSTTDCCIGTFTLERFQPVSPHIAVDANINGSLLAELRDPYGRPIPGYELNSCVPIRGDSQNHILTWAGGKRTDAYRYDVVEMRVEMTDAVVYSITI